MLICVNCCYTYYCTSIYGVVYVALSADQHKCHTKRCLELQDNTAGCMTFVGVANMSAGLTIVVKHMLICPVFLPCILILFLLLHFLVWQVYCLLEHLLLPHD